MSTAYRIKKNETFVPSSRTFTVDEIKDRLRKGDVQHDWLAQRRGDTEWVPIADLEGGVLAEVVCEVPRERTEPPPIQRSIHDDSTPAIGRNAGVVIGIAGLLLLLFGALQWSSIGSQVARAAGQTDGLGIALLLAGAAGVIVGGYAVLSVSQPSAAPQPTSSRSVEERLRQLDELRSKNLITDAEHAQRKSEIIASL